VGKIFSIEEFIIAVFCCVDDWLKRVTQDCPIQWRGFAPQRCESEVMKMEIVGEYLGMDTDKAIWQYFCRHWAGVVSESNESFEFRATSGQSLVL
jgi:hypothetical protein